MSHLLEHISKWVYLPPISLMQVVMIGAALGGLAVLAYWRARLLSGPGRVLLALLRLAAIALLVLCLLNPSLPIPKQTSEKPVMALLLDTSGSMQTADVDGASRLAFAQQAWLNDRMLGELARHYELRSYRFAGGVLSSGPAQLRALARADGDRTNLFESLEELLASEPRLTGGGILLLSDGNPTGDSAVQRVGQLARAKNVPIWTVTPGDRTRTRDLAVTVTGGGFLFARQPARLIARVHQNGYDFARTTLLLKREGEEVARRTVRFEGKPTAEVEFDIREDKAGLVGYTLQVAPLPGEAEEANNRRAVFYQVTDERIRVLLAEASPYWDSKFLAQALRDDRQVELTSVISFSPSRRIAIRQAARDAGRPQPTRDPSTGSGSSRAEPRGDQKVAFPRTLDELNYYDVVIFGRGLGEFFAPADIEMLRNYLSRRGGSIIFARGQAYDTETPAQRQIARELASIEPAVWGKGLLTDLGLELTPAGHAHPSFNFQMPGDPETIVRRMPRLISATRLSKEKAISIVLARADEAGGPFDELRAAPRPSKGGGRERMAAVAYQNFGRGKVVTIFTEGLWRWAFLDADMKQYDSVYALFWGKMVRWLVTGGDFLPGQSLNLTADSTNVVIGRPVTLRAAFRNAPPQAEGFAPTLSVRGPDGKSKEFRLALERPEEPDAARSAVATVSFTPPAGGVYVATVNAPGMTPETMETRFAAYDFSPEKMATSARPKLMAELSRQSVGTALVPTRPGEFTKLLAEERQAYADAAEPKSDWPRAGWLAAILLLLTAEWLVRRRRQML